MIKLKPLISEYVSNPIVDLKRYLSMSSKEQKEEMANEYPWLVKKWAKESNVINPQLKKQILSLFDSAEPCEIIEAMKKNFHGDYTDFLDWIYDQEIYDPPTWKAMRYLSVVKNQWLIHFSDTAKDIWKSQKFLYGTDDLNRLAYSTSLTKNAKSYGGYNFAYDLSDYLKYGRGSYTKGSWKYGKAAVVFRASGIKAYHYGDEEPQVIFWGATAKDIVYIGKTDPGPWGVINANTGRVIFARELPDVVNWIVKNFDQYKKSILPNK